MEVNKPPSITFAIGLCISLPGKSPPVTMGIKASAEDSAVIKIGFRRSAEPRLTLSIMEQPSLRKSLYLETSNIPLRVAIPNSEINPMMAEIGRAHV